MNKNFYVGLDIGTDSVGWAVTDENYNLLKARGYDMWGSYLFDKAETAENRRLYRTARRRLAREHRRILLLQDLFAQEIEKVDKLFFLRLNNSSLQIEDKSNDIKTSNILFNDANYKDKDFFEEYPTIYHLRLALTSGKINDIRFLYLALHHMMKNRGHFLFEGLSFDIKSLEGVKTAFSNTNEFLESRDFSTFEIADLSHALEIIRDKKINKKDKERELGDIFKVGKNKQLLAIIKAIIGVKVNVKCLYALDEDIEDIKEFSFSDGGFDETVYPKIVAAVGEEEAQLVVFAKAIYDWSVLCNIMNDNDYISQAKIDIYDKHKSDLKKLKDYIKANCPDKYRETFRYEKDKNNYAAYIGMDKRKSCKSCAKEKFYDFLRNDIKVKDDEILKDIESGDFLPKQVSIENGVIPYQVNLIELKAILSNAKKQFEFLNGEENGITVAQKIELLLTFKVPYYVGPLDTRSRFAWVERKPDKQNVSVTPWNFDEVIDKDESENKFIRRMTNKCTYLVGEDVLPANSLLYSEFTFLNELNNLKINGEKNLLARDLIFDYAKSHKKVALKKVLQLLIKNNLIENNSKVEEVFSGIDGDFKKSLAPWYDFNAIIGDKLPRYIDMCEEIILWITLVSDKSRLEKRIRQKYGKILTDDEIKRIKGLNYSGWGRLSKKLLTEIRGVHCVDENGELLSIIDAMRKTTDNFQQVLADKNGFSEKIAAYNAENTPSEKVTYKTVEDLYCSPQVKRAIWRSVELVREVVKICGKEPEKIFVETGRSPNDDKSKKKKRTISRKSQILELYKNIKDEERDWKAEIEQTNDLKFNSDKLVLYYRQMGRSMYSGNPIRFEDVFNTNICDIDHIYPQSKIKDDSLDNRVLVFQTENRSKEDKYPIESEIREKMTPFWLELKAKGLITDKKYARLVRNTSLSRDELTDFINRQLVSTHQSTLATINILKRLYKNTEIVYSKAANANAFKNNEYENNPNNKEDYKDKIIKIRELNDLHHAKDAYINIVVGNVFSTKFNHNASIYFKNNNLESYNMNNLYSRDIKGAWKVGDRKRIVEIANKNTCRIVRMTSCGKGELFNATIRPKGANDRLIPLKASGAISDTAKYGGYDSAKIAYFILVKSKDKTGEETLSLEGYPILQVMRFGDDKEAQLRYLKERENIIEPEILIPKIKLNTLFCIDGFYANLRSKSNDYVLWCNANELFLEGESLKTLKAISNYMRDKKKLNNNSLAAPEDISAENNIALYDVLVQKLDSPLYTRHWQKGEVPTLRKKREIFISLTKEQQCSVIMEILHLMKCDMTTADFTLLGGGKKQGTITFNKTYIKKYDIKMILQSPTGYYRKVIYINKLK